MLTVKVSVLVPPTLMLVGLKSLVCVLMMRRPPRSTLLPYWVLLGFPVIALAPLVLFATGQAPVVAVTAVVTSTVMVQVVGVAVPAGT